MRGTLVAFLALFIASPAVSQPHSSVRVQVIDRGQADGILIRTPNEQWIVIDAGTNREQAEAMRDHWGVDRVALAVVSHRHFDHQGGMDEVLRAIPTDRFLGIMDDCPNRSSDDTVRVAVAHAGATVLPVQADTIDLDGVRFIVLPMPPPSVCPSDENNNSVLVRMEFGDFSMLFTGDAENEQRDWLVANHAELLDVDVLKASHHGSHNGTSLEWLDAVTPERVLISAGVDDSYGHPHAQAVNAYIAAVGSANHVYCTNRHMTIRVYGRVDGGMSVFRQNIIDRSCTFDGTHY
jgi:beta-lactamase superfamily II metal-dependent hydrolase